jgi:hypothetical protein
MNNPQTGSITPEEGEKLLFLAARMRMFTPETNKTLNWAYLGIEYIGG